MWPFARNRHPNRIGIQLDFWGEPAAPSYTAKLLVGDQTVVEAIGFIQGADFRLGNIKTEPDFRRRGYAMTVIGTLVGAARARRCATFTFEDVSPHNVEAIAIYRRLGAVALPPQQPGGHADYQIQLATD